VGVDGRANLALAAVLGGGAARVAHVNERAAEH
jgi:hypothetical protein